MSDIKGERKGILIGVSFILKLKVKNQLQTPEMNLPGWNEKSRPPTCLVCLSFLPSTLNHHHEQNVNQYNDDIILRVNF